MRTGRSESFLNLAAIVKDSCVDGPGFRQTIFVQGCGHQCIGCHNPDLQGFGGYLVKPTDLATEVFANYKESMNSYDEELNITLSGGEPMLQANRLVKMLKALKKLHPKINVWCYTGFTWQEVKASTTMVKLAKQCNVIVDGKFIQELKNPGLIFRGSSNQRIIDVKKSLKGDEVVEYNL